MKTSLVALVSAGLIAASTLLAADSGAEVTLSGTGKCAKCSLGIADECQNALVVKQDGKEVTYLLAPNDVSKHFHKQICEEDKPMTVTGKIEEKDGKKQIVPSHIEVAKE